MKFPLSIVPLLLMTSLAAERRRGNPTDHLPKNMEDRTGSAPIYSVGEDLDMSGITDVDPYLHVRGAAQAIDFYKRVFEAEELFRLTDPAGRIGHAEIRIGGKVLMIADEHPEYGVKGPETLGGTSIALHLRVDNVDALVALAVEAGAIVLREVEDQFYGERSGTLRDPFGHEWMLGQEIEKVSPEEMQRRFDAMFV